MHEVWPDEKGDEITFYAATTSVTVTKLEENKNGPIEHFATEQERGQHLLDKRWSNYVDRNELTLLLFVSAVQNHPASLSRMARPWCAKHGCFLRSHQIAFGDSSRQASW